MAKKNVPPAVESAIVDQDLLRKAKLALDSEHPRTISRCEICSGEATQNSTDKTEKLCWVCRRLKISAWRDSDQQIPMQE